MYARGKRLPLTARPKHVEDGVQDRSALASARNPTGERRPGEHTVERAESVDGEPPITVYQAALIRDALGRFGIEFANGDAPGVKLTATKARKGGK